MREQRVKQAAALMLIVCVAALLAAVPALGERPPLVRKAPYVLFVGSDMAVHWQLYSTAACTIEWGTDTTYSLGTDTTSEYGTDHQHSYRIGHLTPGTLYYYRVTAGPEVYTGTFRAAPDAGATSVKFFAYGDTRTYPADHDAVAQAMIDVYTADSEYQTIAVGVGDLVTDGDREDHWDQEFFDPAYSGIQTFLRNVPLEVAMGNHEGSGVLFRKYFPYPFASSRYWSFDYGPCHFTIVDQYVSYATGSPQLAWIENDLASTAKPWKFIVLHEPGWSAGGHSNGVPVQDIIQPLCERYGVAVVFGGHNHYYARASVSGIEHITTGGGGAPLYAPDPDYPYIVAAAGEYHFCKVEVDGSALSVEAVTPDGVVIESFQLELPLGVDDSDLHGLSLEQNYPNPFKPLTSFSFTVPDGAAGARLTVHDAAGRLVRTLVDRALPPGPVSVIWDGRDDAGLMLPSGVYFARVSSGGETGVCKVTLLR